jgi:hypothetical protein
MTPPTSGPKVLQALDDIDKHVDARAAFNLWLLEQETKIDPLHLIRASVVCACFARYGSHKKICEDKLSFRFYSAFLETWGDFLRVPRSWIASPRYVRLTKDLDEPLKLYRIGSQAIRSIICDKKMPRTVVGCFAALVVIDAMRDAGGGSVSGLSMIFCTQNE